MGELAPAPLVPLLLSVSDAATLLGLGERLTRQLVADGVLQSVRIGRRRLVPRHAVEAFTAELERGVGVDVS